MSQSTPISKLSNQDGNKLASEILKELGNADNTQGKITHVENSASTEPPSSVEPPPVVETSHVTETTQPTDETLETVPENDPHEMTEAQHAYLQSMMENQGVLPSHLVANEVPSHETVQVEPVASRPLTARDRVHSILNKLKGPSTVFVLVALLSVPQVDLALHKILAKIPDKGRIFASILIKALFASVIYFLCSEFLLKN